ncbi:hypothetical protein AB0C22_25865 [Micromonospora sp. NPDC048894]|uniref:hypothetical protein n=1 Tax=Micromonospora sp. NPDC048894 TaxID=3155493 RepID=UPI001DE89A2C|nr:hypothetical protein [Micromonospora sp. RL09-050-HVF-A]MBW4702034.1 hypothetical protein [Micromonospora sp. RL09-050-HVF-A]
MDQRYRPKWMMALEMLDELAGWGLRPPQAAVRGYGVITRTPGILTGRAQDGHRGTRAFLRSV